MNPVYLEQLVSKYANGQATDKEVQELIQWYRSQPVEDVEWPVDSPAEADVVRRSMIQRLQQEIAPQKVNVLNFPWMRAAAFLLFFAGIASLIFYLLPSDPGYITVNNPSGRVLLLKLPDSSRVWLNAATELEYAKDFRSRRKLRLTGEAYFEVMADKSHPFVVETGGLQTTVIGTSFNINSYATEALTTISVTGGIVKVQGHSNQPALLTPAMQFQLDKRTRETSILKVDTSSILAWKEGRLQFPGLPLGAIAKKLENWYGYKVILQTPGMAACRYYMTFKNSLSPDQLFSIMSEVADIKYSINHQLKTVTLTGGACK